MDHRHLSELLDYHYWAQERVFDACEGLTTEQFTRDLGNSFSGSRISPTDLEIARSENARLALTTLARTASTRSSNTRRAVRYLSRRRCPARSASRTRIDSSTSRTRTLARRRFRRFQARDTRFEAPVRHGTVGHARRRPQMMKSEWSGSENERKARERAPRGSLHTELRSYAGCSSGCWMASGSAGSIRLIPPSTAIS
jgi:hypothetical protein